MKNLNFVLFFIVLVFSSCGSNETQNQAGGDLNGKISISGAFALYPLAVKWGEEFKKLHPDVSFDIQGGGAGKGMSDALSQTVNLGMVSRDINAEETKKGACPIAVAKDAVIPTINENNPVYVELMKKGVSVDQLKNIWITGSIKTWGELAGTSNKDAIEVFTRSDAAGAPETWAKYLGGKKQEDLLGIGVFGDPGLAQTVTKSLFAIGFNNVNYIYDINSKKSFPGIKPLPIDFNSNGTIDAEENVYDNLDQLNDAIVKGNFPSPPARPLYFVVKDKVSDPLVKAFLNWVLTDGQKYVQESGFVKLSDEILKAEDQKVQ